MSLCPQHILQQHQLVRQPLWCAISVAVGNRNAATPARQQLGLARQHSRVLLPQHVCDIVLCQPGRGRGSSAVCPAAAAAAPMSDEPSGTILTARHAHAGFTSCMYRGDAIAVLKARASASTEYAVPLRPAVELIVVQYAHGQHSTDCQINCYLISSLCACNVKCPSNQMYGSVSSALNGIVHSTTCLLAKSRTVTCIVPSADLSKVLANIRACLFAAWTFTLAIPLFIIMTLMALPVLAIDKVRCAM
eukprot:GHRR01027817.1.p2 GENE.GHRR01027817.1~~GHRR01027817.1.p2  ORF type:complete len:248 (-),score=52.76 GHRR01027817.1:52-795(-)